MTPREAYLELIDGRRAPWPLRLDDGSELEPALGPVGSALATATGVTLVAVVVLIRLRRYL